MIFPFCKTAAAFCSARPGRSKFLSTKPTHSGIAPIFLAVSSSAERFASMKSARRSRPMIIFGSRDVFNAADGLGHAGEVLFEREAAQENFAQRLGKIAPGEIH